MADFRTLNKITSGIAIALFLILLIFPEPIFYLFNVTGNDSADFISRRAAMLFLGFGVICWSSRNAQPSVTRQAISLGIAVSMFGLTFLGIFEFLRGYAGGGIFLAVSTELLLAVSYFSIWLSDKKGSA
jgi:Na+-driven multidrug efflux pump